MIFHCFLAFIVAVEIAAFILTILPFFSNLSFLFDCFQDQDLFALVFRHVIAVFLNRIFKNLFYLAHIIHLRSTDSFLEKLDLPLSNFGNARLLKNILYFLHSLFSWDSN